MDLRDYVRVLRKGWPLILAFVVLGLAAGIGLTLSTTKVYEASSEVYVAVSGGSADAAAQGQTYAEGLVQSITVYANSPRVLEPVIKSLDLNTTVSQLKNQVSADAPLNKTLVNLHVTDTDPQRAARIARALTTEFNSVVAADNVNGRGQQFTKLSVAQPATVPSAPIKPNKVLNIGLGFVVGLLVGVGIVVLRDVLDNTIKSPADFEEYGVPAMGVVPFDKRTASSPVAFRADATGARSEAYRQIRTNLQFVDVDNPPKIISVTSAVPGEGKSTTALNLAAALAEAGSRVCLIEADLRRPSLARVLGLVGDVGFTTVLIGRTPVEEVLQNAGHNLAVLTSGPIPPNPSELLITAHARQIIDEVAEHVDFVVIDTPPLLPVTDGATVATLADATLLVARPGKTTREQAARSVDALEKVGKRPVGVVLNMVTRGRGGYSYEYGYYYTAAQRPRRLGRNDVGVASGQDSPDGAEDPFEVLSAAGVAPPSGGDPYRPAHAPATVGATASRSDDPIAGVDVASPIAAATSDDADTSRPAHGTDEASPASEAYKLDTIDEPTSDHGPGPQDAPKVADDPIGQRESESAGGSNGHDRGGLHGLDLSGNEPLSAEPDVEPSGLEPSGFGQSEFEHSEFEQPAFDGERSEQNR